MKGDRKYCLKDNISSSFVFFITGAIIITLMYYFESDSIFNVTTASFSIREKYLLVRFVLLLLFSASIFYCALFLVLAIILSFFNNLCLQRLFYIVFSTGAVVLFSLLIILTIIDIKIYRVMGMHIYSSMVWHSIQKPNIQNELHFSLATIATIIALIIIVFLINFLLMRLCLIIEGMDRTVKIFLNITLVIVIISGTILSYYTGHAVKNYVDRHLVNAEAFPFYHYIYDSVAVSKEPALIYPQKNPALSAPVLSNKKNVLYILVESLRYDMLTPENMPNLYSYIKNHSCVTSQRHYSAELSTIYGAFSYLYGLNIHYYWLFARKNMPSYPISLLKNNGYFIGGYAASNLKGWEKEIDFIPNQFNKYEESAASGYQKDVDLLNWAKKTHKEVDKTKPYFYFFFVNAPHHNYFYPPEFEKFKPVISDNFNYFKTDSLKDNKVEIFNRYKNAVLYADHVIGELLNIFEADIKSGNLIISVTGDHGEEFWDTGKFGHGKISNNARSSVPMAVCLPGIENIEVPLSSHPDIFPTIIDYLNPVPSIDPSFYSSGISLIKPQDPERYVAVSGFDFPRRSPDVTIINRYGKVFLLKTNNYIEENNNFLIVKTTDLEDKLISEKEKIKAIKKSIDFFSADMNRFLIPQ